MKRKNKIKKLIKKIIVNIIGALLLNVGVVAFLVYGIMHATTL